VHIKLSDIDFDRCVDFAHRQQNEALQNNYKTKYEQHTGLTFEQTLQGNLGEQAIAHYFNYEYVYEPYDKTRYDVLGYEVRTTYWVNGCLLTHPVIELQNRPGVYQDDKPGMYILVTIDKNEFTATIRGWRDIADCNAMTQNWQTGWRYPCFATPQNQLWPIDTLPATKELLTHQKRAIV
jgi:hypothetical protein